MSKETPVSPGELEERLDLIQDLCKRFSSREIVRFLVKTGVVEKWDVSQRQVRNYLVTVKERMSKEGQSPDANFYRARQLARLDHIYSRASAMGDLKTMLSSTREEIQLVGTNRPSAQEDWKATAQKAGVDPNNFLEVMVQRYNEMDELNADQ